jgi:hypothetical protein
MKHDDNAKPDGMFAGVALRFCVVHSFPPVTPIQGGAVLSIRSLMGCGIADYSAELISINIGFTLMIHG